MTGRRAGGPSALFREEFRQWSLPFKELSARKAQLVARRRALFDPVTIKALDLKLGSVRAALLQKVQECPRLQFEDSSIALSVWLCEPQLPL